jgi:hypothetical protein
MYYHTVVTELIPQRIICPSRKGKVAPSDPGCLLLLGTFFGCDFGSFAFCAPQRGAVLHLAY